MLIVDAQIHIWKNNKPTNANHRQVTDYTAADALKEMDEGGVTAALELLKPIAAISTSPETVPAGVEMVRLTLAGRSARMWALQRRLRRIDVLLRLACLSANKCSNLL